MTRSTESGLVIEHRPPHLDYLFVCKLSSPSSVILVICLVRKQNKNIADAMSLHHHMKSSLLSEKNWKAVSQLLTILPTNPCFRIVPRKISNFLCYSGSTGIPSSGSLQLRYFKSNAKGLSKDKRNLVRKSSAKPKLIHQNEMWEWRRLLGENGS